MKFVIYRNKIDCDKESFERYKGDFNNKQKLTFGERK